MAIFHLHMKKISRSEGRSATAAAAYISGEDIHCDREGITRKYAHRTKAGEIGEKFLILPSGELADRAKFWNDIERHHKRGDAVLAREFEIALPHELTNSQRAEIVRDYAAELSKRYGVAVDACIHRPHDDKNHHVHMLLSACHVGLDDKLGKKCVELDPIHCKRAKITNAADEQRERWQDIANTALEAAGHDSRIDHRTLIAQGIDRAPTIHIGNSATVAEADGTETRLGNINRQALADAAELAEIDAEYNRITLELQELFEQMRVEVSRQEAAKNAISATLDQQLYDTLTEDPFLATMASMQRYGGMISKPTPKPAVVQKNTLVSDAIIEQSNNRMTADQRHGGVCLGHDDDGNYYLLSTNDKTSSPLQKIHTWAAQESGLSDVHFGRYIDLQVGVHPTERRGKYMPTVSEIRNIRGLTPPESAQFQVLSRLYDVSAVADHVTHADKAPSASKGNDLENLI
jgi:hypothetical protein